MRYMYADIQKAQEMKLPAVLYAVETYKTPITDNDIKAVENALRRQQQKAPHISWFVAVSDTDSKDAVKTVEKTGTRGRPQTVVTGSKVDTHVHIGLVGDKEQSAYTAAKNVGLMINKRFGKKVTKVVTMQGTGFISYSYQQANCFHTGGDFDFLAYKEPPLWL